MAGVVQVAASFRYLRSVFSVQKLWVWIGSEGLVWLGDKVDSRLGSVEGDVSCDAVRLLSQTNANINITAITATMINNHCGFFFLWRHCNEEMSILRCKP